MSLSMKASHAAPWRSLFVRSCLPKAEKALRAAPRLVEAVLRVEGLDGYWSVMDATLACLIPELKPEILAYYADRSAVPALVDRAPDVAQRLDARLAEVVAAFSTISGDRALDAAVEEVRRKLSVDICSRW